MLQFMKFIPMSSCILSEHSTSAAGKCTASNRLALCFFLLFAGQAAKMEAAAMRVLRESQETMRRQFEDSQKTMEMNFLKLMHAKEESPSPARNQWRQTFPPLPPPPPAPTSPPPPVEEPYTPMSHIVTNLFSGCTDV